MNILPISDIHGDDDILYYIMDYMNPDDFDIVTVSGDLWEGTSINKVKSWVAFQEIIKKPIIMIQGNHDYFPNTAFNDVEDIHLLHNESMEIDGVTFFGTPFTVNFCGWNWMNSEEALFEMWDKVIPENLDVLLSHGPPRGYCDNCNQPIYGNTADTHIGSNSLTLILLDKNPKYVFCGHIHTGDRFHTMPNGTKVYNVSCIDEAYQFNKFNPPPTVIELEL